MMRGALVFAVVLCVGVYEMMLVNASDEDGSYIPVVNGFMKTAYSRIEEADVRSLAASMRGAYGLLCEKYGSYTVSEELRLLYETQRVDLEISMARLQKLGSLLQRLSADAQENKGSDARSPHGSLKLIGLKGRRLPSI